MIKKVFLLLLLLGIGSVSTDAQNIFKKLLQLNAPDKDVILKRDGSEIVVKIRLVTMENVFYKPIDNSASEELIEDNKNIYMIKMRDRGNMFFSEQGEIFFGDGDGSVPDDATLVYLLKGEELVAYDLRVEDQNISFYQSKKQEDFKTIPKQEVFMIKYPNRPIEIINSFGKKDLDVNDYLANIPPDEFVEIKEAQPEQEYIIKTVSNSTIRAMVIYGNDSFVSYYRKDAPKGPLYRILRKNTKSITKVSKRRGGR